MDNIMKLDFIDELKIEGVKYKGYGVLPKYVMLDPDLTIEAKGIYAYFCSYAGAGNSAFPSRDKIIADLKIHKDTYYKHFNVIISQGYITVEQGHAHGGRGNGFAKNIYTLISNPKKFNAAPPDKKHNQAYSRIRFGGLEAAGFGFIPKAVMLDSRLPLKAKAIYAYFCCFSGSGNAAFPKKETMLYHLGITHNTYQKFYNTLVELNYITVVQRHVDGRLNVNDYYLNNNPDEEKASPKVILAIPSQSTKISDTQIQYTKKQDAQKQDAQKQDAQIWDTNINNIEINNLNNNQSINQQTAQPTIPAEPDTIDRLNDREDIVKIEDELLDNGTLPYEYLSDDRKLTAAIHYLTDWKRRNEFHETMSFSNKHPDIDLKQEAFNLFVEALIEMLTPAPRPMKLKGAFISYSKIYDRLVPYIKKTKYLSTQVLYLDKVEEAAIEGFINGCRNTEIKNHLQYMKSCIWTALQTGEIGILAQIKHDFG